MLLDIARMKVAFPALKLHEMNLNAMWVCLSMYFAACSPWGALELGISVDFAHLGE